MSIINELVTLLGFKLSPGSQRTVDQFDKGLEAVHKTAVVLSGAILAATASVAYFTEKVSTSAAELDKYAELTGASVEEIQKWGYAAEQAGGSAKSVKSDIEGLLEAMNPVMPGEFNQGLFLLGMYGQKYKDTTELMLALSDKLKGMAPMEQMNWAKKAGISPETLLLLKRGRAGINDLMAKTPYLMGKEQTESARKFEAQIHRLRYTIGAFGELVVTKTLPALTKLVDKFERWVGSSKVHEFLQTLIGILSDPKLIGGTIEAAIYGIVGATVILEAKFLAIAAAVALTTLAIRDFIETSQGVGNTLGNRVANFLDKTASWTVYTPEEAARAKEDIKRREAAIASGEKSTLLKVWDTTGVMMQKLADNINKAEVGGGYGSTPQNVTNNVTNNVTVDGGNSPYQTGQEVSYQLGKIQWGDLGPARR